MRDYPETRYLALASVIIGLWVLPVTSSLWVDEAGTWWVIRDGVRTTIERAIDGTGQSPLYYVALWGWTTILGTSEVAMRALSLLAAGATAFLTWRLGRKLLGPETAWMSTIALASLGGFGSVAFSAADARPYAFGLAFVAGATLALVRWVEAPRPATAALYAIMLMAAVYSVYTYAAIALGHLIFLRARAQRDALPRRQILITAAGLTLGLIPALLHLRAIFDRPNILESVPFTFSAARLLPFAIILGAMAIGLGLHRGTTRVRAPRAQPGTVALLTGWAVVPLLALLILALTVAPKFFYARYYLAAMPGLALLAGWMLASLSTPRARATAALALAALALVSYADPEHTSEDWRAAAAVVEQSGSGTLVLLRSGFAGSKPDRLQEPDVQGLVRSPLDYHLAAPDVVLVPFRIDTEAQRFLEDMLRERLRGELRVALVTRAPHLDAEPWLTEHLGAAGFRGRTALDGAVRVVLYRRA